MLILDPCIDRIVGQDSRGGGWTELVLKIFSSLTYTVEFLNLDIDAKLQCVARHDKTGTNSVTFFWSSQTVFLIGPHTPGLAAVCGPIRKKLQRSPFTLTLAVRSKILNPVGSSDSECIKWHGLVWLQYKYNTLLVCTNLKANEKNNCKTSISSFIQ